MPKPHPVAVLDEQGQADALLEVVEHLGRGALDDPGEQVEVDAGAEHGGRTQRGRGRVRVVHPSRHQVAQRQRHAVVVGGRQLREQQRVAARPLATAPGPVRTDQGRDRIFVEWRHLDPERRRDRRSADAAPQPERDEPVLFGVVRDVLEPAAHRIVRGVEVVEDDGDT